jgi:hypothetical protein
MGSQDCGRGAAADGLSAARKGKGKEAKLCYMGHALMENRNGLAVDGCLTQADGHAKRIAALAMIEPRADRPGRIILGADKGYGAEDFVNELRSMNVTPHVAAKAKGSALDGRTAARARGRPVLVYPCCRLPKLLAA